MKPDGKFFDLKIPGIGEIPIYDSLPFFLFDLIIFANLVHLGAALYSKAKEDIKESKEVIEPVIKSLSVNK